MLLGLEDGLCATKLEYQRLLWMWVADGHTDTTQWKCHNCICGKRAVENFTQYPTRIENIPVNCLRSTSWQSVASIPLLEDTIYETATSWAHRDSFLTQSSVDKRNVFKRHSYLDTRKSSPCQLQCQFLCCYRRGHCHRYLSAKRLSDRWYRNFLQNVLPGLPEAVTVAVRKSLWCQRDGAPTDYRL